MNTPILALSAAALLFAAPAVHATPSELQLYTDRADAQVRVLLRASGIDWTTRSVSVRATVEPDGSLGGIRVVRGSGSRDADRAAQTVLRKVLLTDPLIGLMDGAVTLNVGQAAIVQAKAP